LALKAITDLTIIIAVQLALLESCNRNVATRCQPAVDCRRSRVYHDRWEALLASPLPELLRTMTEASAHADALRQESPCTVFVKPD